MNNQHNHNYDIYTSYELREFVPRKSFMIHTVVEKKESPYSDIQKHVLKNLEKYDQDFIDHVLDMKSCSKCRS